MPPPRYETTRILPLADAWELLSRDGAWELVERYAGARVRVGTPAIRGRPRTGASAVVLGPKAREGQTGIETETPHGPAGARWLANHEEAARAFDETLRTYAALTTGDERLFRVKLLIEGELVDDQLVAIGEVSPDPDFLDGLSLTYIGVLAGIALALAFGIEGLTSLGRLIVGLVVFFGLAVLLRIPLSRRSITRFARWALPGAHDRLA
jgi:hypothetical protein